MKNQNCRVGSINSIPYGTNAISALEFQYQRFMEKASNMKHTNSDLANFFELKATKIRKILEGLIA